MEIDIFIISIFTCMNKNLWFEKSKQLRTMMASSPTPAEWASPFPTNMRQSAARKITKYTF